MRGALYHERGHRAWSIAREFLSDYEDVGNPTRAGVRGRPWPPLAICRDRNEAMRVVHTWDKDGVCIFCDVRSPGHARRSGERRPVGHAA